MFERSAAKPQTQVVRGRSPLYAASRHADCRPGWVAVEAFMALQARAMGVCRYRRFILGDAPEK